MNINERYDLIVRNLQETIIESTTIKKIISKRDLKIYWGTAPTGEIHIGYFVPLLKIADFVQAGCHVIILVADLHAVLDNMKSSFEQVTYRTQYYIRIIKKMLSILNVDMSKITFVRGSTFQLSQEYTIDMYKAHTLVTLNEAKHAGAEVVKQSDNPKLNSLMYPTLQALDEEYLDVDVQFGGIDQRKIFMHARELLPKLGYKKRFYLMNELIPGLRFEKKKNDASEKMSASDINSKINMLDTLNQIKKKINRAYCLPGDVDDNCLMVLLDKIIMPILIIKGNKFVINRKEEFGGSVEYEVFDQVKEDFSNELLHPMDLKNGLINAFNIILTPVRDVFQCDELKELVKKAY
jgi:tyrosyl-tRNA synthetase